MGAACCQLCISQKMHFLVAADPGPTFVSAESPQSLAVADTLEQSRWGWSVGWGVWARPPGQCRRPGQGLWPSPALRPNPNGLSQGSEHPENSAREGARGPQPGLGGRAEGRPPASGAAPPPDGLDCRAETGHLPIPEPALGLGPSLESRSSGRCVLRPLPGGQAVGHL